MKYFISAVALLAVVGCSNTHSGLQSETYWNAHHTNGFGVVVVSEMGTFNVEATQRHVVIEPGSDLQGSEANVEYAYIPEGWMSVTFQVDGQVSYTVHYNQARWVHQGDRDKGVCTLVPTY